MYLRCVVHDSPLTWKSWLSLAELWYNTLVHSSLGCTPFKALYGYDANLGAIPTITPDTNPDVNEVIQNRKFHLQSLKEHLARAQNKMKQTADTKRTYFQFTVGDQVLLKLQPYTQSSAANRPFPKLAYKYYGPYTILQHLEAAKTIPLAVLERRMVKKGNAAVPQVKIQWTGLPASTSTWEDYYVVKTRFPDALAWGQADSRAGGGVKPA
ncbi:uncharacterized protein [Miscanthus floridulus]|uniref:uncharacterized protein n=1 Tax=Miscanthus floridulus TaxID=154761 RepID=UPI00345B40CB